VVPRSGESYDRSFTNQEREFGQQIEVRCWNSDDAVTGTPTEVPFEILTRLGHRLTEEVPGVVSVTYNVAAKPPSTIEAI